MVLALTAHGGSVRHRRVLPLRLVEGFEVVKPPGELARVRRLRLLRHYELPSMACDLTAAVNSLILLDISYGVAVVLSQVDFIDEASRARLRSHAYLLGDRSLN